MEDVTRGMIKKLKNISFKQVILALSCALFVFMSVPQFSVTPAYAQPAPNAPAPAPDDAGAVDEEKTCEDVAGFEMGWAVCPILRTISKILDTLVEFIVDQMDFDDHHRSTEVQNTWTGLRNVARVLYSLALAFVIYAVATGGLINALDARKMATRLFIAILLVELSFSVFAFFIDVTNDIGQGIGDFILTAGGVDNAENLGIPVDTGSEILDAVLGIGDVVIGLVAVIIGLLGFIFMLSGLLVLWLVVLVRNFVVLTLFVLSPLAIVMYSLPFGDGIARKWWTFFSGGMFLYPILTASLAMGALAAKVTVAASGEGLGRLVAIITANLLTFGTPLAVGYILQTVGGTFGRFAGIFDKNGKRFNLLSRLRGSDAVQEPLARARAGKNGAHGSLRARTLQAASNPLGYLADSDSRSANFWKRSNIIDRAAGRANAKSNAVHTELVGKYLKELDTRGVVTDSYRDSQLAQSLWGMQRYGSEIDQENAQRVLSHLSSSNSVLYGNVMRNMSYLNSHPEAALASFQGLANMGKLSLYGEKFGVRGLEGIRLLADDGTELAPQEGDKFKVGEGFDTANLAIQYMEEIGYDEGTMGVAIQGLGNASYGKGQQLDKYLSIYDKDGEVIRGRNGRMRIDRNKEKALEKAGPRFWLGGNESVKQGAEVLEGWVQREFDTLQKMRSGEVAGNIAEQEYALHGVLSLAAQAETMTAHPEQKNRMTMKRTLDNIKGISKDAAKLTVTTSTGVERQVDEVTYRLNAARQQQRSVSYEDALQASADSDGRYGGSYRDDADRTGGGADRQDPLAGGGLF